MSVIQEPEFRLGVHSPVQQMPINCLLPVRNCIRHWAMNNHLYLLYLICARHCIYSLSIYHQSEDEETEIQEEINVFKWLQ